MVGTVGKQNNLHEFQRIVPAFGSKSQAFAAPFFGYPKWISSYFLQKVLQFIKNPQLTKKTLVL